MNNALAALPPLWRNRDYMLLWSGQTVSMLGGTMSSVVFPLLVLALSNSPASAGVAGALFTLPYMLFSLLGGALIDRWDRKRVMILCDAGRALSLASVPVALAFNVLTVWQLYANAFIEGTLFVFFNIAEVASLPRVVPTTQLPAAAGQNETASAAAGLIGPSLGGLLYQSVGRAMPFILDAVSYIVSVVSLLFIHTPFQAERAPVAGRNLRAEIAEGVRWLWGQRLIRFLAFLAGGTNFAFAAGLLVIIVRAKELGAGEAAIGTIFSIGSLGGLLGAVLARRLQGALSMSAVILAAIWTQILLFPLYAVAPHVFILSAITGVIFFVIPVFNVVVISYRLSRVPDALQGRVNSAARMIVFMFQPLGSAVGGVVIERFGGGWAVALCTAVLLGLGLLTTLNQELRVANLAGAVSPPVASEEVAG